MICLNTDININIFHACLLNHRPARTWFLKIDPIWIIGMRVCVCMSVPKAINN